MTQLLIGLLWAAVLLVSPALVAADQATYIYDDLGRLSQVIDGQGNVATYSYDAVGNLLSIARNTGGVSAPTITAFTPNTGNAKAAIRLEELWNELAVSYPFSLLCGYPMSEFPDHNHESYHQVCHTHTQVHHAEQAR